MTLLGLKRDVDKLKVEVRNLRPSYSAGTLTNHTTRGVTRTAFQFGNTNLSNTTSTTPRWQ